MLRLGATLRLTQSELFVFRTLTGTPYATPKNVREYNTALKEAAMRLEKGATLYERESAVLARELLLHDSG